MLLLALSLALQGRPIPALEDLPVLEVTADDTVIDRSCRVRIAPDLVLVDGNGDGVLHVVADGIVVAFEEGSVLRGAAPGTPEDTLEGIGVRVADAVQVTLKDPRVEGYRCGILATEAHALQVDGARLRHNFRQRLASTPAAEDTGDWLWPHANDGQEWWQRYGAGICVERSSLVTLRGIEVRAQQNGILLDRVSRSWILENDCSFLSGWGIAMWRCSDNEVLRNRLDYNVRGYSHGVYNRGQDSAGLLMFEQCQRNLIEGNSATHCGDGIFAFSGREALGEEDPGVEDFDYRRRGNNDNVFLGNRLDHAVAHGLELTFGFGNRIEGNSFVGNGICGVWAGYSQETAILANTFADNGAMGYGLERGGINIDHSQGNLILWNTFEGDRCGVHLWRLGSPFAELPWGQANLQGEFDNLLHANRFAGVEVPVHLRGAMRLQQSDNVFLEASGEPLAIEQSFLLEGGAATQDAEGQDVPDTLPAAALPTGRGLGGRETIVMTEWGPWDGVEPVWQKLREDAEEHVYRALPAHAEVRIREQAEEGISVQPLEPEPEQVGAYYRIQPEGSGYRSYRLEVEVEGREFLAQGAFLPLTWKLTSFVSPCDPREDVEAWREGAGREGAVHWEAGSLSLVFGMEGPAAVVPEEVAKELQVRDHFGTLASAEVVLPAGTWTFKVHSDDGVRLWAEDQLLVDDWTHHAPRWAEATLVLEDTRPVGLRVEHFELDGYAVLEVELQQKR